ncbi:hypothetical protein PAPYR_823 [Paratrimastix pyriformis]|uniref:Uncharacterized protein n=1 Tax=Paratrimastix pyriformis TaxID=342808 RepID=A0ABQ8UWH5_9EUKA|nr:hypothetical protein PAPYR_823 [Paratrimastix pyriformis]
MIYTVPMADKSKASNYLLFRFWDLPFDMLGQLPQSFYSDVRCALILYDITDRSTFEHAFEEWWPFLQRTGPSTDEMLVLFLGAKADLATRRAVRIDEAEGRATGLGQYMMEVSAQEAANTALTLRIMRLRLERSFQRRPELAQRHIASGPLPSHLKGARPAEGPDLGLQPAAHAAQNQKGEGQQGPHHHQQQQPDKRQGVAHLTSAFPGSEERPSPEPAAPQQPGAPPPSQLPPAAPLGATGAEAPPGSAPPPFALTTPRSPPSSAPAPAPAPAPSPPPPAAPGGRWPPRQAAPSSAAPLPLRSGPPPGAPTAAPASLALGPAPAPATAPPTQASQGQGLAPGPGPTRGSLAVGPASSPAATGVSGGASEAAVGGGGLSLGLGALSQRYGELKAILAQVVGQPLPPAPFGRPADRTPGAPPAPPPTGGPPAAPAPAGWGLGALSPPQQPAGLGGSFAPMATAPAALLPAPAGAPATPSAGYTGLLLGAMGMGLGLTAPLPGAASPQQPLLPPQGSATPSPRPEGPPSGGPGAGRLRVTEFRQRADGGLVPVIAESLRPLAAAPPSARHGPFAAGGGPGTVSLSASPAPPGAPPLPVGPSGGSPTPRMVTRTVMLPAGPAPAPAGGPLATPRSATAASQQGSGPPDGGRPGKKEPRLFIDIALGDGRVGHVGVCDGDNSYALAELFVRAFALSRDHIRPLGRLIERRTHDFARAAQLAAKARADRDRLLRERGLPKPVQPRPFTFATAVRAGKQRSEPIVQLRIDLGHGKVSHPTAPAPPAPGLPRGGWCPVVDDAPRWMVPRGGWCPAVDGAPRWMVPRGGWCPVVDAPWWMLPRG